MPHSTLGCPLRGRRSLGQLWEKTASALHPVGWARPWGKGGQGLCSSLPADSLPNPGEPAKHPARLRWHLSPLDGGWVGEFLLFQKVTCLTRLDTPLTVHSRSQRWGCGF